MDQKLHCHVYKKCGGCQLDVAYPQQLSYKQRTANALLGRFHRVEPIVGMAEPLHYRCKVSAAFYYSRGHVLSGVWQSSSGRIVPVEGCALENKRAEKILVAVRELLPRFGLRTFDERSRKGFLRFVTIRIGRRSGEILLALGTGAGEFPEEKRFAAALAEKCPEITTIVRCISADRLNLLLGREERVLYGPGCITDSLCGFNFRISARSFFQVNPEQTERLYSAAIELAGLDGSQTVIDAYCGVGTIGITASSGAGRVIAVEVNGDAVKNARENVRLNGIENVEVIRADAGELMASLAESGERVDVVFTDPPRAGCSRQFLASLVKLSPARVVYISCNPETQARDLQYLTRSGYSVDCIRPFDMFPFTRHIETVCLLSKNRERIINRNLEKKHGIQRN